MKLGLIARADSRGLGHLTWAFHENMRPDRTLIVDTSDPAFPIHPGRYRHGEIITVKYSHRWASLPEKVVREWLDGLDVVYSAETVYDWRLIEWAREMGVRTVIHGMPELTAHLTRHKDRPHPDEWWWPTRWLTDRRDLPPGPVVPIPCPEPMDYAADPFDDGPLRIVHPAGRAAVGDRDGTRLFCEMLGHLKCPVHVTIVTQDGHFPHHLPKARNLTYEVFENGLDNRFDIYKNQHLTVLPRRYGGLSLKVLESLACGVPVMMPMTPPNNEWPGPRITVSMSAGPTVNTPFGTISTVRVQPRRMANVISHMANDRKMVADEMAEARQWAEKNTWDYYKAEYYMRLSA